MGKKRERVRQCRQIRQLVDENKYTKALALIDELPLEEVGSLDDLYLYAELYEKAERFDKKKEIFYMIYDRTKSRIILEQLLRLTIRLGELDEARDLYINYEMAGDVTLDTYELRYLLAKAEGKPVSGLIEILEDLKREEYTEEWGLQLARLYEREGLREKCIQECKDLKLWFGEGDLVDKAMELQRRCEDPSWEPPVEEIPEPEKPERPEEIVYAAPAVDVMDVDEEPEEEETEEVRESAEVSYGESVSEPVVVKKETSLKRTRPSAEELAELLDEDTEDISEHGIRYFTLKSTINHVRYGEDSPHFVFAGGEERITLAVAKRITKELNNVGYVSAHSIVKITADKLNQINLEDQMEKIAGGCMLVTSASELSEKSVKTLTEMMDKYGEKVVVMLAGPFDEMDCFLDIYPELAEHLTYKVRM